MNTGFSKEDINYKNIDNDDYQLSNNKVLNCFNKILNKKKDKCCIFNLNFFGNKKIIKKSNYN